MPGVEKHAQRYEIRVRGVLGPTLREAFAGLRVREDRGDSVLTGRLPDQAALHGVLAQIESLNLELIEIRRRSSSGFDRIGRRLLIPSAVTLVADAADAATRERKIDVNKILTATFDSEQAAFEGLSALQDLHRDGDITLYASSVIAKDQQGNVAVRQAADRGPAGTLVGLVTGGLVGVVGGPAGVAVGAYLGGFGGLMYDLFNAGVGMDFVDEVSASLTAGKVAVVADIEESWVTPVDVRLGDLGGTTIRHNPDQVIDDDLARETEAASKELADLEAELRQTSAEAKANVEAAIARARRKLQDLTARIDKVREQQKAEFEARLRTLQAQLGQSREGNRQRVEARIDELKSSYEARRTKLEAARRLAKQSAETTREAIVG